MSHGPDYSNTIRFNNRYMTRQDLKLQAKISDLFADMEPSKSRCPGIDAEVFQDCEGTEFQLFALCVGDRSFMKNSVKEWQFSRKSVPPPVAVYGAITREFPHTTPSGEQSKNKEPVLGIRTRLIGVRMRCPLCSVQPRKMMLVEEKDSENVLRCSNCRRTFPMPDL